MNADNDDGKSRQRTKRRVLFAVSIRATLTFVVIYGLVTGALAAADVISRTSDSYVGSAATFSDVVVQRVVDNGRMSVAIAATPDAWGRAGSTALRGLAEDPVGTITGPASDLAGCRTVTTCAEATGDIAPAIPAGSAAVLGLKTRGTISKRRALGIPVSRPSRATYYDAADPLLVKRLPAAIPFVRDDLDAIADGSILVFRRSSGLGGISKGRCIEITCGADFGEYVTSSELPLLAHDLSSMPQTDSVNRLTVRRGRRCNTQIAASGSVGALAAGATTLAADQNEQRSYVVATGGAVGSLFAAGTGACDLLLGMR
ncbi:MAG: hypothetical protein AAGD35_16735 [Actinomycetota bacterium]